ncbi:hypothetical protein [Brevundimonas sp.]|uniref:TIR domain-containing protein n=1 Tax=Brevundimonas sp. TaxID=1871086 RepID=UPI0025B80ADC|nr:hypothetical protein [Brevundimonas sp.]
MFISFDYDHDSVLKEFLVGQSKLPDTPFELADWSIKEPIAGDWEKKAEGRVGAVGVVAVICGENTHTAKGVTAEIKMAQKLGIPYFLLKGYKEKNCTFPVGVTSSDKMYNWTWDNLKLLVGGSR